MSVQERGQEKRRREAVDEWEYKKEDGRRGEEKQSMKVSTRKRTGEEKKQWRGDIV